MSESQNNNQDPNNVDDEKRRTADASAPLDVSGSFQLAQNPEQFFQGSIPASDSDAMQTRSFSFASSQFNPDPSAQTFNPNVINPDPPPTVAPQPPANYNSLPEPSASYTPPAESYNPQPADLPSASESYPDSSGAFNPDPAADFQGGDFFDNSGRQAQNPQSYASQPQVFRQEDQPDHDPGIIPNTPANSMRPQSSNDRRLPGGFFDVQENAGTAGGALPASPAASQFNQNYHPGVTAQQAFFAGNDVPQLPAPSQQQSSSFQDFYQDPSPAGKTPTQQPTATTPAPPASGGFPQFQQAPTQHPNQQPQNQQLQNQAAQAPQYPAPQAQTR